MRSDSRGSSRRATISGLRNPWPSCASVPPGPAAALAALHLTDPQPAGLANLSDADWRQTLDFCYRSRILPAFRAAARGSMPAWVRRQTDGDACHNLERLRRLLDLYGGIQQRFAAAGVSWLALKGIAHYPLFVEQMENRVQYDVDLFTPGEHIRPAHQALLAWGYEPLGGMERFPTDHLPALVRKNGWEFRGDYFDPDMPFAVELHFRFWDAAVERLPAPGVEEFWRRREIRRIAGLDLPVLAAPDALGYAALHVLRHLLRGDAGISHVYELAGFLHAHAGDDAFWSEWQDLHGPELRRLEAIAFRLAREWFGCDMGPAAEDEIDRLPDAARAWFDEFALSPARQFFRPGKDELWLHLGLLTSRADRWSVARRRLFPLSLPNQVDAVHLPVRLMTWRRRALERLRWLAYSATRVLHHAMALPRTVASGARWRWHTSGLGGEFGTFLAAAVLLNLALFIFALLYNIHLLDLGYREDFLGVVNGSATAGTVAGTLPTAVVVRRFGLRRTLLGAFAANAAVMALRAVVVGRTALVGLACVWGLVFAGWAVAIAPAIAGAVDEKRRPAAFSVFFATMFAVGIAGNWVGGRLPGWVHGKQPALLLAAAVAALALWPAWRLKLAPSSQAASVYPRGPFLARYLAPFALWQLATGSFNQFANVYFVRMQFSLERIGAVFSASQVVQVAAVLCAPLVFRRFGLVTGIVATMAAAALGLGGLALQPAGAAAVATYAAYMAFQWMSEPGLNTLLMNHVEERERSGASSLNYLVAFSAQAIAAFGAGALLARFGYGAVLGAAAAVAGAAAVLFRMLITS